MKIKVKCTCGKSLVVDASLAGHKGKCPECGERFIIPAPTAKAEGGPAAKPAIARPPRPAPAPTPTSLTPTPADEMRVEDDKIVGKCSACGKDITSEQHHTYGYFCSTRCKQTVQQSEEKLVHEEEFERDEQNAERFIGILKLAVKGVVVALAIGLIYLVVSAFLQPSAELLWEFKSPQSRAISVPVVAGEYVLVAAEKKVRALNPQTGEESWSVDVGEGVESAPLITLPSGMCIARSISGIYGVNCSTMKLVWSETPNGNIRGGVVVDGGKLFYAYGGSESRVEKAKKRGEKHKYFVKRWSGAKCIDPLSGEEKWTYDMKGSPAFSIAAHSSSVFLLFSPGLANKSESDGEEATAEEYFNAQMGAFGSGEDTVVLALDASTGKEKWTTPSGSTSVRKLFTTSEGVFVLASDALIKIKFGGSQAWNKPFPDGTSLGKPVIGKGTLFFKGENGILYCINQSTGDVTWQSKVGSMGGEEIALLNDMVFCTGETVKVEKKKGEPDMLTQEVQYYSNLSDGFTIPEDAPGTYAFNARTGEALWKAPGGDKLFANEGILYVVQLSTKVNLLNEARRFGVDSVLVAFDPKKPKKPKQLGSQSVKGRISGHAVSGDTLFVTTTESMGMMGLGGGSSSSSVNRVHAIKFK